MNFKIPALLGTAGSLLSSLFGGWDLLLQTLLIFMGIDLFTGGFLLPVIFKKSLKSETGTLESRAGWKGLCRKGMTLLFVLIAVRLDLLIGGHYFRDAVCIAFIANEALSIIENVGLMGMPLPEALKKAVSVLEKKGSEAFTSKPLSAKIKTETQEGGFDHGLYNQCG